MTKIVDKQLDELLRCVPVKINGAAKKILRDRVSRVLMDAKSVHFDFQTYKWDSALIRRLATLRRHLSDVRVLLGNHPGLMALLNVEADLCAHDPASGFALFFDPDPEKGLYVRGRRLVAMSSSVMGKLEGLTSRAQKKVADSIGKQPKSSNAWKPHLNFLASVLVMIFKDVFGSNPKNNAMTYNPTTDRGSPLIEFVRCGFRLAGESDDGDGIKQRLIALRKKTRTSADGWPIHY